MLQKLSVKRIRSILKDKPFFFIFEVIFICLSNGPLFSASLKNLFIIIEHYFLSNDKSIYYLFYFCRFMFNKDPFTPVQQ